MVEWTKIYIRLLYGQKTILNSYSNGQEGLAPAAGALCQCEPLTVACDVVLSRCRSRGVMVSALVPLAGAFRQCEPLIVACSVVSSRCCCRVSRACAAWYRPWCPWLGQSADANRSSWCLVSWCCNVVVVETCARRVVLRIRACKVKQKTSNQSCPCFFHPSPPACLSFVE